MAAPLFPLGQLVATPGALALLADGHMNPTELLARHQAGDWGEVPPEDARENELSVLRDFRILSSYRSGEGGEKAWIIPDPSGRPETMRPGDRNKVGSTKRGCEAHAPLPLRCCSGFRRRRVLRRL